MVTTLIVGAVIAFILAILSLCSNGSIEVAVDVFLTFMNRTVEFLQSIIDKLF